MMSPEDIIKTLRSINHTNPNKGIEVDDLLANDFIALDQEEAKTFWIAFANAMNTLLLGNEATSFYLASRFLYNMSISSPPRKPTRKSDFNFIIRHDYSQTDPLIHAGGLLTSLVLQKGDKDFWIRQKDISLENLNDTNSTAAMDAIVYAYIGLNRAYNITADNWVNLFATMSQSSQLPEFELIELLVSIDKENAAPSRWNEELELGLDTLKVSTENKKYDEIHKELLEIFRAWLELNEPRPFISTWLKKQLNSDGRQATSPRVFSLKLVNNQHPELLTA